MERSKYYLQRETYTINKYYIDYYSPNYEYTHL